MRDRNEPEAGAWRFSWLDLALILVFTTLATAFLLAEPSPDREWKSSASNALLGLNFIAWGVAFAVAYRLPRASVVLQVLANVATIMDRLGPIKLGHIGVLIWAIFLLCVGSLMLMTGAGWV